MNRDDERFENYLREFEPRQPGALHASQSMPHPWRRLAAAAAIGVAAGVSLWFGQRRRAESRVGEPGKQTLAVQEWRDRQVTLGELRRLANDPQRLDAALADASRQELPDFRESTSALRVLAKE